jgi:hypothetical protein
LGAILDTADLQPIRILWVRGTERERVRQRLTSELQKKCHNRSQGLQGPHIKKIHKHQLTLYNIFVNYIIDTFIWGKSEKFKFALMTYPTVILHELFYDKYRSCF